MAPQGAAGGGPLDVDAYDEGRMSAHARVKRRHSHDDRGCIHGHIEMNPDVDREEYHKYKRHRALLDASHLPSPEPPYVQNDTFFIIKESKERELEPDSSGCSMERTRSGLSISSDSIHRTGGDCPEFDPEADMIAARRVRDHVSRLRRDTKGERILKSLIHPKSANADFPLDNTALQSIFSAANELFFSRKLSQRVIWDWSYSTSPQYNSRIIGTTNLRESKRGGYECLIVLSSPILKDTQYNRRLLISTFLHELIHCYLFVCNGFEARHCGGHTDGFKEIATLVDGWVGRDILHLRDMEADLEHFRNIGRCPMVFHDNDYHSCSNATFDGAWDDKECTYDRWGNQPEALPSAPAATNTFY